MKAWLVFIDESGLLMAPLVRRSWAPRGQTPFLCRRSRSHRKVSAIAALGVSPDRGRLAFWFRLHPDRSLNADGIVEFLRQLRRHIPGPLVVVWDRLGAHKAAKTQQAIRAVPSWSSEWLPAYAPELNPVEYAWSYLKYHRLGNQTWLELEDLADATHRHARSVQRRPELLRAFLKHSGLPLRLN